ncbi:MAG: ATP-binding protein [Acidimicrobiales bacterium]
MRLSFGDVDVDLDRHELRRDGQPVNVEPQVFDVLAYLVLNRDRLVPKEELLDQVWGDRFVSESALTTRIKAARQAVGDDGRTQRYIKTIHGRGYRFIAEAAQSANTPSGHMEPLHNLPSERSPLFGRDDQIVAVKEAVESQRLVTLLGMGGAGKTRLAVATARSLLEEFPDGIWFVDLIPAADANWIVTAMADAAGLAAGSGDPSDELAQLINNRRLLYIMDNCETAVDLVAEVVDHLLDRTTVPHFLLTSREPVELVDEHRVTVEPLTADPGAAMELLRTAALRFGVDLSQTDDEAVRRICVQLDGLPLALELAAGQLRQLSVEELSERLDRRFDVLVGANRRNSRQASLAGVLEDTWQMLDPEELELINQLAAFPSSFDVASVEELTNRSVQRELGGLVDRSLVTRSGGSFKLLDSVRLFSQDQDPNEGGRVDLHAEWCLERVNGSMHDTYYSYAQAAWCSDHFEDIRSAQRHLVEQGRVDDAARVINGTGLAMHMDMGARPQWALRRIDELLATDVSIEQRAQLNVVGTAAAMAARDPYRIQQHGMAALDAAESLGPSPMLAFAQVLRSWSLVFEDRLAAIELTRRAIDIATQCGDQLTADVAAAYQAIQLCMVDRYEDGALVLDDVIARYEDVDAPDAYPLYVAVVAKTGAILLDDPAGAARLAEAFVDHPTPTKSMIANQILVATARAANSDADGAVQLLEQCRKRLTRARGETGLPDVLIPAGVFAVVVGDSERAREVVRAVRDSDRPTQSFQMTIAYRMLRDKVGIADVSPLETRSMDQFATDTFTWMRSVA